MPGKGVDILIIDDPIKGSDAMSEVARAKVIEWFRNTAFSRLDSKEKSVIIVIAQRTHEGDLPGFLLETDPDWTHLNIPAIAVEEISYPIGDGEFYVRPEGEALHAARESLETLSKIKNTIGSSNFATQYQQNPLPLDGNMVKQEWFKTYKTLPAASRIIQSWDTATETGAGKSYSVGITAAITENACFITDVVWGRMKFPDLKQEVIRQVQKHAPDLILVEKAASGIALLQELTESTNLPLKPVIPRLDKETRFSQITGQIEGGRLFVPEEAPWKSEFLSQLFAFPNGKYDDMVDALSQLLRWFAYHQPKGPLMTVITNVGRGSVRDRYAERMGGSVFGNLFR